MIGLSALPASLIFTLPATIVIESAVLWVWQKRSLAAPFWPLAGWLAVLNVLTQVVLAAGLTVLPYSYLANLLLLEAAVVISEGVGLSLRLPAGRAFGLSLLVNTVSLALGLVLPV